MNTSLPPEVSEQSMMSETEVIHVQKQTGSQLVFYDPSSFGTLLFGSVPKTRM